MFTDFLAESLLNIGIGISFIDYDSKKESLADQYIRAINKGFDAAIAFNSSGYHETYMENDNIFDYLNVPFYNWIVDHPNEHNKNLNSNMKNYHVICIDRNHASYVKQYYPNVKDVHFLPLGGQKYSGGIDTSFESYSNRDYDVTFCASLGSIEKIESMIDILPAEIKKFVYDVSNYMLEDKNICYEDAITKVLFEQNLYFDVKDFKEFSQGIGLSNLYLQQYIRRKTINSLVEQGISIDIFGNGWDAMNFNNAKIHGAISYEETLKIAASSKISLNIMPIFKGGIHDRISTSMINGAAVASDLSNHLQETFMNDCNNPMLLGIENYENAADVIANALDNLEDTYRIAMHGKTYADMNLTWDNRAYELLKILKSS
jgi:hypothetical protein